MSDSADIGSPWDPVETTHTVPGPARRRRSTSTKASSGTSSRPEAPGQLDVLGHRAPEGGHLAPCRRGRRRRPAGPGGCGWRSRSRSSAARRRRRTARRRVAPTVALGVGEARAPRRWSSPTAAGGCPGPSARAPMRARSVSRPSTGVRSILKSPECRIDALGGVEGGGEAVGHRVGDGDELDVEGPDRRAARRRSPRRSVARSTRPASSTRLRARPSVSAEP